MYQNMVNKTEKSFSPIGCAISDKSLRFMKIKTTMAFRFKYFKIRERQKYGTL